MKSTNRVILVGRVAADPELRYTTNELPVARFTIGVKRDDDLNEMDLINIVAWGGLAKVIGEYVKKGDPIVIEGKLEIKKYEKDGIKRSIPEIRATNIQLLDKRFFNKNIKENV